MKKLLLILLLTSSLFSKVCWNTDTEKWIPFSWLPKPTTMANAVDDELTYIEVSPAAYHVWGCSYIKEYRMNTLSPDDIKTMKKTLKHGVQLGVEPREHEIIIFTESPQNPQEIIGTIHREDLDEVLKIVYGV